MGEKVTRAGPRSTKESRTFRPEPTLFPPTVLPTSASLGSISRLKRRRLPDVEAPGSLEAEDGYGLTFDPPHFPPSSTQSQTLKIGNRLPLFTNPGYLTVSLKKSTLPSKSRTGRTTLPSFLLYRPRPVLSSIQ